MFLLLSCSKYKAGDVIDGDDIIPPNPPFMTKFTLEGADADNDGVRDDVEIWINENIYDTNARRMAKSFSKNTEMLIHIQTEADINDYIDQMDNFHSCHSFMLRGLNFDPKELSKILEVQEIVYSNFLRRNKVKENGKKIPPLMLPRVIKNDLLNFKTCNFQIDNLDKIVKKIIGLGFYKKYMTFEEQKEFEALSKK